MRQTIWILLLCLFTACNAPSPSTPEDEATFTPATIVWEEVATAPLGRSEGQSAVVGDKLYVFGGYTDYTFVPKSFASDVYDPDSDTWKRLPDTPRPLTHAGTAEDDQNIYLAGGVVGPNDPDEAGKVKIPAIAEVWRFNTATSEWSAMPPLPEPRGAGALVVLGGDLHYFGGTGEDRYQSVGEHWALPLDGSSAWRALAPLPNPRNHLAGIVIDNSIYAIGGQQGHNETLVTQASVQRYDPASDSWVELASLPYGLGHISNSTVEVGGRIYVVGGETSEGVFSDDVLVYDPELDAWSPTNAYLRAENALIGGAVGSSIFITGGSEWSLRTVRGRITE